VHEDALNRSALADPAGRVTALAGALLVGALAVALQDGRATLPLALACAGTALALFVLVPRALAAARRHPALLAGAVVVGALPVAVVVFGYVDLLSLPSIVPRLLPLAVIGVAAFGGLVLLADDLRARLGVAGLTPWQRLTGTAQVPAPAPWRALGGLALVGLAAAIGLAWIGAGSNALLLLALAAGAGAVIAAPVTIAGLARADRTRVALAREDERRRVAAHLHDSVLQTLALVQRQANDPAAVARLARRQEHELRAWMAGEVELGAETLGAALRRAVAEVEDDYGAAVELTLLGERPLDRQTEALAGAAREALRNAARHAPGAPIYLFAQAGPDGAEVFVRDEGPGFDLATVPSERRGVRDSIVGRMAAVGGTAEVDARPGEGTEVALRIGVVA